MYWSGPAAGRVDCCSLEVTLPSKINKFILNTEVLNTEMPLNVSLLCHASQTLSEQDPFAFDLIDISSSPFHFFSH